MHGITHNSVRVVARFRPPLLKRTDDSNKCIHMDASQGNVTVEGKTPFDTRCFTFDRVYPPETPQEDMMEEVTPLIEHVLNGLHANLFVYGQTGSGKTYTVDGLVYAVKDSQRSPKVISCKEVCRVGMIPRSIDYVFQRVGEMGAEDENVFFDLSCSYYQLYNERVTDLLKDNSTRSSTSSCFLASPLNTGLRIHSCDGKDFQVKDLTLKQCKTREEMHNAFLAGARKKVIGRNAINRQSSRSHCVFTIYVVCHWKTLDKVRRSAFTVVDLAGSEKIFMFDDKPPQNLLREAIEINTSLLALRKVILALAARAKKEKGSAVIEKRSHIPYRDSKLTMLLKHTLEGNSRTTMIACINTSSIYITETVSTLLYAGIARRITHVPKSTAAQTSSIIRQLLEEKANMLRELEYYRSMAAGNHCVSAIADLWCASDKSVRIDG